MSVAPGYSQEKLKSIVEHQDGTTTRHFPRRHREWCAVEALIGDAEQALRLLGGPDAEFLRLVYGVGRPQVGATDAYLLAWNRWPTNTKDRIHGAIGRLVLSVGGALAQTSEGR